MCWKTVWNSRTVVGRESLEGKGEHSAGCNRPQASWKDAKMNQNCTCCRSAVQRTGLRGHRPAECQRRSPPRGSATATFVSGSKGSWRGGGTLVKDDGCKEEKWQLSVKGQESLGAAPCEKRLEDSGRLAFPQSARRPAGRCSLVTVPTAATQVYFEWEWEPWRAAPMWHCLHLCPNSWQERSLGTCKHMTLFPPPRGCSEKGWGGVWTLEKRKALSENWLLPSQGEQCDDFTAYFQSTGKVSTWLCCRIIVTTTPVSCTQTHPWVWLSKRRRKMLSPWWAGNILQVILPLIK